MDGGVICLSPTHLLGACLQPLRAELGAGRELSRRCRSRARSPGVHRGGSCPCPRGAAAGGARPGPRSALRAEGLGQRSPRPSRTGTRAGMGDGGPGGGRLGARGKRL